VKAKNGRQSVTSFLALYHGETIGSSRMVAVCADPTIVGDFADRLLDKPPRPEEHPDPVVACLEGGRRKALQLIRSADDNKRGAYPTKESRLNTLTEGG
jgi:hypothetical protein